MTIRKLWILYKVKNYPRTSYVRRTELLGSKRNMLKNNRAIDELVEARYLKAPIDRHEISITLAGIEAFETGTSVMFDKWFTRTLSVAAILISIFW